MCGVARASASRHAAGMADHDPDGELPATRTDRRVLLLAAPLVAGFAAWGLAAPDALRRTALAATGWLLADAGWLVVLMANVALGLVIWLGVGPWRDERLGRPGERPQFGTASWLAMLFAAGMGTGLVVWGVAEPVTHLLNPPGGPPGGEPAVRALVLTYLHWGFHAWAIYALAGLVIGWFAFRRGDPPLVSAPLRRLLPGRAGRLAGPAADALAILAVTFGVAGTLAMGMLTLRSGLSGLGVALAANPLLPPALLLLVGGLALASALSGLARGIRLISDLNVLLALGLMAAVLVLGPSARLLSLLLESAGAYVATLPSLGFSLRATDPAGAQWTRDWTLTYLLWWLAWGPFVGVFIARISRGRRISAYLAGVILVPVAGSIGWFAVMGGSGLLRVADEGAGGPLARLVAADPTGALTHLLSGLPAGGVLAALALLLLLLFLVTSVDSAIYVLGMMTSGGAAQPPAPLRLLWGVSLVALAGAMLAVADVGSVRAMAILGALPYPLILATQVAALLLALRRARA